MIAKKCFLVLLLILLCFTFIPYTGLTADIGRFYFSNLMIDKQSGQASVDLLYQGNGGSDICFIVAFFDNQTGNILAIDKDSGHFENGQSGTLSVSISVENPQSGEYKYFLWDNLNRHTPLDNVAPASPKTAEIVYAGDHSMTLNWSGAADDHNEVAYYNIYDQGMFKGSSTTTEYIVQNLDKNESCIFEITAVDSEGLESVVPLSVEGTTKQIATCLLSGNNVQNSDGQISFWLTNNTGVYGYTEKSEANGRECRVTTKQGTRVGMFFFTVDSLYFTADDNRAVVEITYFDEGEDTISLEYTTTRGAFTGKAVFVKKTNTMQWITTTKLLTDAKFLPSTDAGNGYANLRVKADGINGSEGGLKLYRVSLYKESEYMPDAASVKMFDTLVLDKMKFIPGESAENGLVKKGEIAGTNCLFAPNGKYFEFNVDDSYIGSTLNNVTVEVLYYDNLADDLVMEYNSISSVDQQMSVHTGNSGRWRKVGFTLNDAAFKGSMSGGGISSVDFRLKTAQGSPLYIKSVRVYPN